VAIFVLHAAYLFRAPFYYPAQDGELVSEVLRSIPGAEHLLRILPAPFVHGADFQASVSRNQHGSFLDYETPHWAYYLTAFTTKVPLSVLLLFLLGFLPRRAASPGRLRFGLCVGLPAIGLLVYLTFFNNLQNGIRYALPVVPLLTLTAGGFTCTRLWRTTVGRVVTSVACLWILGTTVMVWPQYLGYFNEAIGGSARGYLLFTDSNCDWSQNVDEGRTVLIDRHPGIQVLDESSGPRFGLVAAYMGDFRRWDVEREKRLYHWLRRFRPIDHHSSAWLAFRIEEADYTAALRGGDERAARDLALAWLWEGDMAQARDALRSAGQGTRVQELGDVVDILELMASDGATQAQVRNAYDWLRRNRHDDLALRLATAPDSPIDFDDLIVSLQRGGRSDEAIRILQAKRADGPLTPSSAMKLAALLLLKDSGIIEALEVLDSNPAPAPGDDIAERYAQVRAMVERAAHERRRLIELAR